MSCCDSDEILHNSLGVLQGGVTNERYHLTRDQWHNLISTNVLTLAAYIPTYEDEDAAVTANLPSNTLYKTSTGEIRYKL